MNKIYLDCTHTYNSGQNTGIQRVVKNIVQNRFEVSKLFGIEIVPVVFYNKEYKKFDRFPDIRATSSIKKYKVKNILKKVLSFFRKFFSKVKVIDDCEDRKLVIEEKLKAINPLFRVELLNVDRTGVVLSKI